MKSSTGIKQLILSSLLFFLLFSTSTAEEICDNGVDDDGDGNVDLNDAKCGCTGFTDITIDSFLTNPSFEETTCCPTSFGDSMMQCVTGWSDVSSRSSNYFRNDCRLDFNPDLLPYTPIPKGGSGYVRIVNLSFGIKAYVGSCLKNPMIAGKPYTLDFWTAKENSGGSSSNSIEIAIFGTPDCAELPFNIVEQKRECPAGDRQWIYLGSTLVEYVPNRIW